MGYFCKNKNMTRSADICYKRIFKDIIEAEKEDPILFFIKNRSSNHSIKCLNLERR